MTHDYFKNLYPGYDAARGIPCCPTNEKGYPCKCTDPAPIPEALRKPDPYSESTFGRSGAVVPLTIKVQDDLYDDGVVPERPPGLYLRAVAHLRQKVRQYEALCAFKYSGGVFEAYPHRPFKPLGLMIWGAPDMSTLDMAYVDVGTTMQLLVSMGKFPAKWFSQSQSFEQIFERMKAGLAPAGFGDWDTCTPGVLIRVLVQDKDEQPLGPEDGVQIGMWGWSVA